MKLNEINIPLGNGQSIPSDDIQTIGQYIQVYKLDQYVKNGVMEQDLHFTGPNHVVSWDGCPTKFHATADFSIGDTYITSIEGMNIEKCAYIQLTSKACIRSYKGIQDKVGVALQLWLQPAECMLGSILIPGLHHIRLIQRGFTTTLSVTQREALEGILNRHLADKDINACQEEMIDAGFGEFAGI